MKLKHGDCYINDAGNLVMVLPPNFNMHISSKRCSIYNLGLGKLWETDTKIIREELEEAMKKNPTNYVVNIVDVLEQGCPQCKIVRESESWDALPTEE